MKLLIGIFLDQNQMKWNETKLYYLSLKQIVFR